MGFCLMFNVSYRWMTPIRMLLSSPSLLGPPRQAIPRWIPATPHRNTRVSVRFSLEPSDGSPGLTLQGSSHPVLLSQSSAPPPTGRNIGFRRDPELGLCFVLFVISMALGSFFSLAVISLPASSAFRRLAVSMDKLSKVVSEEVPGTLSSLKLSGLEINDLTSQLSNIRQRISGSQYGKKARTRKPGIRGRQNS